MNWIVRIHNVKKIKQELLFYCSIICSTLHLLKLLQKCQFYNIEFRTSICFSLLNFQFKRKTIFLQISLSFNDKLLNTLGFVFHVIFYYNFEVVYSKYLLELC